MQKKRIIMSLGMLAFVGAVVAGGTGAFFSDTETSSNNVFTAGSVSLTLDGLDHTYLAEGNPADPVTNYVTIDTTKNSFQFNDLKPLDYGKVSGTLTNGANDALVCARMVDTSTGVSPFQDMLKFRVGGANGLAFSFQQALANPGLDQWLSLDPLNPTGALVMTAGQSFPSAIEYCFGKFVPGGGCELDPAVADYNLAQNQTLTLDIEYYAEQKRNNSTFTCSSLNN